MIPAIRARLGPMYAMKSDREIGHIVRAVLAEIREPSEGMAEAADRDDKLLRDDYQRAWTAMIDALAKEVEG